MQTATRRVIESIEARTLLATLNGTSGNDIIDINLVGTDIVLTLNGTPNTFPDASNSTIVINAGGGDDTITLRADGDNATTLNGGDGNDSIVIGVGNYAAAMTSSVLVNGDANTDSLSIDDGLAATAGGYTINQNTFTRGGAATVTWGASIEAVTAQTSGFDDLVSFVGTSSTAPFSLSTNAGADLVTVGNDFDSTFFSDATINAGAGTDSLTIDDSADNTNDTYVFNAIGSTPTFGKNTATGTLSYPGFEIVTLNANHAGLANTFNVLDLDGGPTTINAGDADDTLNYSDGVANLDTIDTPLTFNADVGNDRLNVNAQAASPTPTYTLNTTTFSTNQTSPLTYAGVDSIAINGSTAAETYNVNATTPNVPVTVTASDGNDTLNVGGGNYVANIGAGVLLNGGLGGDSLVIDDSADPLAQTWNFNNGTIGTGGPTTIGTNSGPNLVENFRLRAGSGADTINVPSVIAGENVTVAGGAGNDTVVAGSGRLRTSFAGNLTDDDVIGDVDQFILDDSLETLADTYTFDGTGLTKTGMTGKVNATANVETLTLTTGVGALAQTVNWKTSAVSQKVTINVGDGNDTVAVGNGDWAANIGSAVSIVAGAGVDSLSVIDNNNATNTGESYTLGAGSLTKVKAGAAKPIQWDASLETLDVSTSQFADNFVVNQLDSTLSATVHGNNGDDTLDASAANDIDASVLPSTTLNFDAGAGTDSLSLDDSGDAADADAYSFTGTRFSKPGASGNVDFNGVELVGLIANAGANPILVSGYNTSAAGAALSIDGGGGDDHFDFPAPGGVSTLIGVASVTGGAGNDTLNVDDSATASPRNWTINTTQIRAQIPSSTTADLRYGGFETITVSAGDGADTVAIDSLQSGAALTFNARGGADQIAVGGGDLDSNFGGIVTVDAGDGGDTLTINDASDDPGADLMSFFVGSIVKGGATIVDPHTESLIVQGSPQPTTYNVNAIAVTTSLSVVGGAGNDLFNVGGAGADIDAGVLGNATLTGGAGNDSINYNDAGDTPDADAYTFAVNGTLETFTKTGAGVISIDASNAVTVNANDGSNTIDVQSLLSGSHVINAGAGDDAINVQDGGSAGSAVTIASGTGLDSVNVDSDNDGIAAAVAFAAIEDLQSLSIGAAGTVVVGESSSVAPAMASTLAVTAAVSSFAGVLDLRNGYFINRAGATDEATWAARLTTGCAGGLWTGGPGSVVSATAAASGLSDGVGYRLASEPDAGTLVTFGGVVVSPGDVLLGYTLAGDTDLDRQVSFSDLLRVAQNFDPSTGGKTWVHGNFDFDAPTNVPGAVGFSDLLALAQNYQASVPAAVVAAPVPLASARVHDADDDVRSELA